MIQAKPETALDLPELGPHLLQGALCRRGAGCQVLRPWSYGRRSCCRGGVPGGGGGPCRLRRRRWRLGRGGGDRRPGGPCRSGLPRVRGVRWPPVLSSSPPSPHHRAHASMCRGTILRRARLCFSGAFQVCQQHMLLSHITFRACIAPASPCPTDQPDRLRSDQPQRQSKMRT